MGHGCTCQPTKTDYYISSCFYSLAFMFDIHAGIGLFDSRHASQNTDLLMQTKISVRVGDFIFYVAKWDKENDRYNYLLRNKKKKVFLSYTKLSRHA
jgi:hypothetical protein